MDGDKLLSSFAAMLLLRRPFEITAAPNVKERAVWVSLSLKDPEKAWTDGLKTKKVKVTVAVSFPWGASQRRELILDDAEQMLPVPIGGEWQEGVYKVQAELALEGTDKRMKAEAELALPKSPWLTSDTGKTDRVLQPWTPVELKGRELSVRDRRYSFGNEPWPTAILNQGRRMLMAPARLVLKTPAGKAELKESSFAVSASSTRAKTVFKGTGAFAPLYCFFNSGATRSGTQTNGTAATGRGSVCLVGPGRQTPSKGRESEWAQ